MRSAALLLVSLLVLFGCDGAPAPRPDVEPAAVEPAAVEPATPDTASSCVEDCLLREQMRAEPVEQIRAECRAECAASPESSLEGSADAGAGG